MTSPLSVLADIAERRIAEAINQGAFDALPGAGKVLVLEDDSMVPEDLRMAYKVLRNAGYIPTELVERKEISNLIELMEHCEDEVQCLRQMQKLQCLLRNIGVQRQRPMQLEENDPYFADILQRVRVVQRRLDKIKSE